MRPVERDVTTGDGRRLRTLALGDGPDLVVCEAGLGVSGRYWEPTMRLVADAARVVAYERAGIGHSTPDPAPRDLARLADDLDVVVDAYDGRRLVLVGHSLGGPVVRLLAARRLAAGRGPTLAGLVLVDPSDEHADLYFSRAARWGTALTDALLEPAARLGLSSVALRLGLRGLPRPVLADTVRASASVTAARATAAEDRHVEAGLRRLRTEPPALGDLPVRLLSGQRSSCWDAGTRAALVAAHRVSVAGLPAGRLVPAWRSGHLVPVTEPDVVAREVRACLALAGGSGSTAPATAGSVPQAAG